jgi:predicted O-methyltransferase YrrM
MEPIHDMSKSFVDETLDAVLEEYEARQAEEDDLAARLTPDEVGRRRDELLVSVGRATGTLLNLLVRESRARSILELGTSSGYSTLWLADAARATAGRVRTVDVVAAKQQQARLALERVGLLDYVDCQLGDAIEFLRRTDDTYDFVLLDVWKDAYIACADAVLPRLRNGAIIVADNMLHPPHARLAALRYQAHMRRLTDMQTVLLPVGHGLAISRYRA